MEKVLNLLLKNSHVISLTQTVGYYDLGVQLLGRNRKRVKDFLDKKIGVEGKTVILEVGEMDIYSMKIAKPLFLDKKEGCYKIDSLDTQILEVLALNSRENIVEIARKIKSNVEVVRYRLKRMKETGVIKGFYARTNKHRMGLNTYIMLLNVRDGFPREKLSKFNNIYYAANLKVKFNYVVYFFAEDNNSLFKTINSVRETLGENLTSYELLTLLYRRKLSPLPKDFIKTKT